MSLEVFLEGCGCEKYLNEFNDLDILKVEDLEGLDIGDFKEVITNQSDLECFSSHLKNFSKKDSKLDVKLEEFLKKCKCEKFQENFLQKKITFTSLSCLKHDEIMELIPQKFRRILFLKKLSTLQDDVSKYGEISYAEIKNSIKKKFLSGYENNLSLYIFPRGTNEIDSQTPSKRIEIVKEISNFLNNKNKNVLLLLGSAGSGKSLLCQYIASQLLKGNDVKRIPLLINLCNIIDPTNMLITKYFTQFLDLPKNQIRYIKSNFPLLIFLDGFDEISKKNRKNLFRTNMFNTMPDVKVIVTCRIGALHEVAKEGNHYKETFSSYNGKNGYEVNKLQQIVINPFSNDDIVKYIRGYSVGNEFKWSIDEFMEMINKQRLMKMMSNPFLLKIALESLSETVKSEKVVEKITRYDLYNTFLSKWIERESKKLLKNSKKNHLSSVLEDFCFDISKQMFMQNINFVFFASDVEEEEYIIKHTSENGSYVDKDVIIKWKNFFQKFQKDKNISSKIDIVEILNCLPLSNGNNEERTYKFIHKSFWEFIISKIIINEINNEKKKIDEMIHMLNVRLINDEVSIIKFISNYVKNSKNMQRILVKIVRLSRERGKGVSIASSNAMTILNFSDFSFSSLNLSNVHIEGANLYRSNLEKVNFSGSNLSNVTLKQAYMRGTNFENCNMKNIELGESPFYRKNSYLDQGISTFQILGNGKYMLIQRYETPDVYGYKKKESKIDVWNTDTYEIEKVINVIGTRRVQGLKIHPKSDLFIFVHSSFYPPYDVVVWNGRDNFSSTVIGTLSDNYGGKSESYFTWHPSLLLLAAIHENRKELKGNICIFQHEKDNKWSQKDYKIQKDSITSLSWHGNLEFLYLASSSKDKTIVVLHGADNYKPVTLTGHSESVNVVSYHPSLTNVLLASGSDDKTIRIWPNNDEKKCIVLNGHLGKICNIKWHPNRHVHILASGDDSNCIFLWNIDVLNGKYEMMKKIEAHKKPISFLQWHPNPSLSLLASATHSGEDKTIKVWDGNNDYICTIFEGDSFVSNGIFWKNKETKLLFSGLSRKVRVWNIGNTQYINKTSNFIEKYNWNNSNELIFYQKDTNDWKMCNFLTNKQKIVNEKDVEIPKKQEINKRSPPPPFNTHDKKKVYKHSVLNLSCKIVKGEKTSSTDILIFKNDKEVKRLKYHKSMIWSIDWHPNFPLLATCGWEENYVLVWDINNNYEVKKLEGHEEGSNTNMVSWCPDPSRVILVSCSEGVSNTLIIWEGKKNYKSTIINGICCTITDFKWHYEVDNDLYFIISNSRNTLDVIDVFNAIKFARNGQFIHQSLFGTGSIKKKCSDYHVHPKFPIIAGCSSDEVFCGEINVFVKKDTGERRIEIIPFHVDKIEKELTWLSWIRCVEWIPDPSLLIVAAFTPTAILFWNYENKERKRILILKFDDQNIRQHTFKKSDDCVYLSIRLANGTLCVYSLYFLKKKNSIEILAITTFCNNPFSNVQSVKLSNSSISRKNFLFFLQKGAFGGNNINFINDNVNYNHEIEHARREKLKKKMEKNFKVISNDKWQKFAFVVGNSEYIELPKLKNPINDAKLVESVLRDLNFSIHGDGSLIDVECDDFLDEFDCFCRNIQLNRDFKKKLIVFIYYAGHGINVLNEECLVPVDVKKKIFTLKYSGGESIERAFKSHLKRQIKITNNVCVTVKRLMSTLKIVGGTSFIFLDACRDSKTIVIEENKEKEVKNDSKEQKEEENECEEVEKDNRTIDNNVKLKVRSITDEKNVDNFKNTISESSGGFLITYSTNKGNVSLDGEGNNSCFTESLCNVLQKRGEVFKILSELTKAVVDTTNSNQHPIVECSDPSIYGLEWPLDEKVPQFIQEKSISVVLSKEKNDSQIEKKISKSTNSKNEKVNVGDFTYRGEVEINRLVDKLFKTMQKDDSKVSSKDIKKMFDKNRSKSRKKYKAMLVLKTEKEEKEKDSNGEKGDLSLKKHDKKKCIIC